MTETNPKSVSSVDTIIGRRLREKREAVGLTQIALGKLLGVTFQQIQKYETATSRISAARLMAMARVLKVPITYFYDGL